MVRVPDPAAGMAGKERMPWNMYACIQRSQVRCVHVARDERVLHTGEDPSSTILPHSIHSWDVAADPMACCFSNFCRCIFSLAMISPGVSGLPWVVVLILARKARDSATNLCLVAQGPLISQ